MYFVPYLRKFGWKRKSSLCSHPPKVGMFLLENRHHMAWMVDGKIFNRQKWTKYPIYWKRGKT